jgi:hypothetical protein
MLSNEQIDKQVVFTYKKSFAIFMGNYPMLFIFIFMTGPRDCK